MNGKGIVGLVALGIVALFGLSVVFGSFYRVDQHERTILTRNGAIVAVMEPGLHYKFPFIEAVHPVSVQTLTYWYGKARDGSPTMEAYSADQQPAHMYVSVTLHVAADKVSEMYSRFGGDFDAAVQRLIAPHLNQELKVVFGKYTAARSITERGKLNIDVKEALVESLKYDPIFAIEGVQIENITFSAEYIKSVEQRMMAEVAVQQKQQLLLQEKINADIAVTKAQGEANSTLAVAKANAEATRIRGEAEASSILAQGEALAKNSGLVALEQARKWNGVLPTTMLPGNAVPMLNIGK